MEFNKAALSLSDALPGDKKLAMNRLLKVRPATHQPSTCRNSQWHRVWTSLSFLHPGFCQMGSCKCSWSASGRGLAPQGRLHLCQVVRWQLVMRAFVGMRSTLHSSPA